MVYRDFCLGDHGQEGIDGFLKDHRCRSICKALDLQDQYPLDPEVREANDPSAGTPLVGMMNGPMVNSDEEHDDLPDSSTKKKAQGKRNVGLSSDSDDNVDDNDETN
jgi:hypothetical protein